MRHVARRSDLLVSSSGLLFLVLAAGSFAMDTFTKLGEMGERGDTPAEDIAAEIDAHQSVITIHAFLTALAGVALLGFTLALHRATGGLSPAGVVGGVLWGALWIVAGVLLHASVDLAGHFAHPEGAKTVLVVSFLFITSPPALLPALLLLGATAAAARRSGRLPRWYGTLTLVATVFTGIGTIGFATYFAGAVSLVFLPVWLLGTAALLPWWAWRGSEAVTGARGPEG